jgi:hypothetical protein
MICRLFVFRHAEHITAYFWIKLWELNSMSSGYDQNVSRID